VEALGGPWTNKKLEKVRKYLISYQQVLSKQAWVETVYIDAFCGPGRVQLRGARDFTEGSALQAICLEKPFNQYHLIEKSKSSLDKLREQVRHERSDRLGLVQFHQGDVNLVLPQIIATLDNKRHRAVVFADPYGMQLDWRTVEAVARKPIIDFWLLVPTGMGMHRLAAKNPARMQKGWPERLDRFLGEPEWRTRWYQPTGQISLFGEDEETRRTATLQVMDTDFQARLKSIFPCVADHVLHLTNGKTILFSLMFACSNPSEHPQKIAKRIAEHLLRG
jgi:three-Cys-motif partner protein